MVASASKLAEQNVRVIVVASALRARTIPHTTSMFCWGVYVWDGPDVCRIRTVRTARLWNGHANWANLMRIIVPICKVLSCEVGRGSSVVPHPAASAVRVGLQSLEELRSNGRRLNGTRRRDPR
jgi:hypothetical protein